MSTTTCSKCGKTRTAKIKKCPYCPGAKKSSKLNLIILVFAISAAASVITIVTDSKSEKKADTVTTKKPIKKKLTDKNKGVSLSQVVGSLLKSSSAPKVRQQTSHLAESEDIAQAENI